MPLLLLLAYLSLLVSKSCSFLGIPLFTASAPRSTQLRMGNSNSATKQLNFEVKTFEELTNHELYDLLRLRSDVFVVEQTCVFLDLDDNDQKAMHVLGWGTNDNSDDKERKKILAYARIFGPGAKADKDGDKACIGRVVTDPKVRGKGYGYAVMREAMEYCVKEYPQHAIIAGTQHHLGKFYGPEGLGFDPVGDVYDEDGIPHIDMVYTKHLKEKNLNRARRATEISRTVHSFAAEDYAAEK